MYFDFLDLQNLYNLRFYSLIIELRELPIDRYKSFKRNVISNVGELKKGIDIPNVLIV